MEQPTNKDRWCWYPARRPVQQAQGRSVLWRKDLLRSGSTVEQSRGKSANCESHWHLPVCFGKPCPGIRSGRAFFPWTDDNIRYPVGFSSPQLVHRQKIHNLCKHGAASVHGLYLPAKILLHQEAYHPWRKISNRLHRRKINIFYVIATSANFNRTLLTAHNNSVL